MVLDLQDSEGLPPFVWKVSHRPIDYAEAMAAMERDVPFVAEGGSPPLVWLLTHPSVYTLGTSGSYEDVMDARGVPVLKTGRGGQVTYHGPGQRVVYFLCPLRAQSRTLKDLLQFMGLWVVAALKELGLGATFVCDQDVGVWCETPQGQKKIAFMGLRVRQGVSYHGFSINVCPDLSYFHGIRPCGLDKHQVTSLAALGKRAKMPLIDKALYVSFRHLWPSF